MASNHSLTIVFAAIFGAFSAPRSFCCQPFLAVAFYSSHKLTSCDQTAFYQNL
jgi:hypothetical protein